MLVAFLNSLAGLNGAYPDAVYHALIVLGAVLLTAALAGYWRIFEKMGEPGWKALVPFYNNWIIFDRCSEFPHMFFVYLVAGIVEFASNFGVFGMFSASVEEWARIICSGTELYMFYGLARCFGKGWGSTLGLWLAEFVFAPLLGFGTSRFVGRRSSSAANHSGKPSAQPHGKSRAKVAGATSEQSEAPSDREELGSSNVRAESEKAFDGNDQDVEASVHDGSVAEASESGLGGQAPENFSDEDDLARDIEADGVADGATAASDEPDAPDAADAPDAPDAPDAADSAQAAEANTSGAADEAESALDDEVDALASDRANEDASASG